MQEAVPVGPEVEEPQEMPEEQVENREQGQQAARKALKEQAIPSVLMIF